MAQILVLLILLFACASPGASDEQRPVGSIDFFGYKGFDLARIRAALPVREGDMLPGKRSRDEWIEEIRNNVRRTIGRDATDVTVVCCDSSARLLIYIGLPGESSKPVVFRPKPNGTHQLPDAIVDASAKVADAWERAVLHGKSKEDDSQGYALSEDPDLRSKQIAFRDLVRANERIVIDVLQASKNAAQRAVAATATGYLGSSDTQVKALVAASLDPNEDVRNNSVRALSVLARARPTITSTIPDEPFLSLLSSGIWSDRNKGVMVLDTLTVKRDPRILDHVRWRALDSLIEMARWKTTSHAFVARVILGRIAGIDEQRIVQLADTGRVDEILAALRAGALEPADPNSR